MERGLESKEQTPKARLSKKRNRAKIKKPILFSSSKFLFAFRPKSMSETGFYRFRTYRQELYDITSDKVTAEIVEKSQESVKKQRSKKKRWLNFAFLMLNLAIVVGILVYNFVGNGELVGLGELFTQKINWGWLLAGVGIFLLIGIADSSRIFILISHITKRPRPFLSYKSAGLCRFYDVMTPLSTGGEPFQVFYLNKRGLPAATATSVPIAKYIYSQFYFIIFTAAVLILQHNYIVTLNPLVLTCCYIGFAINAFIIASILFLSSSKRVAPACAVGILKLLAKMRIVKDYRKTFVKVMHTVREYVSTMRQFVSNIGIALLMLVSTAINLLLTYSSLFIVYAILIPLDSNWLTLWVELMTIAVVFDMAFSIIPLPGGVGVAEVSFLAVLGAYFGPGLLMWAMLLWRSFTYYAVLLQGILIIFYDFLVGNKKIAPLLTRFKAEDKMKKHQNTLPKK